MASGYIKVDMFYLVNNSISIHFKISVQDLHPV